MGLVQSPTEVKQAFLLSQWASEQALEAAGQLNWPSGELHALIEPHALIMTA